MIACGASGTDGVFTLSYRSQSTARHAVPSRRAGMWRRVIASLGVAGRHRLGA
jgi:hypothetical protein